MSRKLGNLARSGLLAYVLTALVDNIWRTAEKAQFGEVQTGRYGDDLANFLFLGLLWQAWYFAFSNDNNAR